MSLLWQRRLIAAGALILALVCGSSIAQEEYLLAGMLMALAAMAATWKVSGLSPDVFFAGLMLFGYLVGNRGFAQLQPPGVPLLPAEAGLALGAAFLAARCVLARTLPFRRQALDLVLVAWIAVGAIRFAVDFRTYAFTALRDFAMVYYAVFFLLARQWGADPAARRWLLGWLLAGVVVMLPLWVGFTQAPDFFITQTAFRGIPLIYYKGDVAAALMAAAAAALTARALFTGHRGTALLAAAASALAALSNSRAALVALAAGGLWALAVRHWRFVRFQLGLGLAAVAGLGLWAAVGPGSFHESRLYLLYESVASIADPGGEREYQSQDLQDKPDNNRFRSVWWQQVAGETLAEGPWLGLGFGYNLADEFTRVYFAEATEEFTARSPHNFLLTVFARMGVVGLLPFLAFLGLVALRTWRSGRLAAAGEAGGRDFGLWVGAWVILVSACFGVVLEGPMGAVIFWTVLGLASAGEEAVAAAADEAETLAHLPAAGAAAEVRSTP
jgi:O-antigen ligase